MKSIDLNADIGEGHAFDVELLKIISSASIACGGHAGNVQIMAHTLAAAKHAGVCTGAHPGFVDRENFGRVRLKISATKIANQVVEQVELISGIAKDVGHKISYVKLHGALYNWAAEDVHLATSIFSCIKAFDPSLAILAMENSAQVDAALALRMTIIREAFADRAYTSNGNLVSRSEVGAVFSEPERAQTQAINIALNNSIVAASGQVIPSKAQSICLHGDNNAALALAQSVRKGLREAGVKIKSVC